MEFQLDGGWKIVQVIEKSDNLPNLTIRHDIPPRGHGRSAHSVLDEVEIPVFAQAGMRLHELGCSWIEGRLVITDRIVRSAVAVSTLVAIQAGAIEQVGLSRRDRIRLRYTPNPALGNPILPGTSKSGADRFCAVLFDGRDDVSRELRVAVTDQKSLRLLVSPASRICNTTHKAFG